MIILLRPAYSRGVVFSLALIATVGAGAQQPQSGAMHREAERSLAQTVTAGTTALETKLGSGRSAISVVVADFNSDGTKDLVTGYATGTTGALLLQEGDPHALSPTPAQQAQIAAGQTVAPFVSQAVGIDLPVRPDLLAAGDVAGHGHEDLVVAAKGDTNVYLLKGDGAGDFSAPQALALEGKVSSLATWRGPEGANVIVAGICGVSGCGLSVLDRTGKALGFVPMSGSPTAIETGHFNRGIFSDLAVIAGGNVLLVDGDSALTAAPQVETLPVSHAVALASGYFVYDRRGILQLAVLDAGATLHILTRAGLDNTVPTRAEASALRAAKAQPVHAAAKLDGQAWAEALTLNNIGPGDGGTPVMLRGHFTAGGNDDLTVLSGQQNVLVANHNVYAGGVGSTTTTVTTDSTSAPVVAAVATRVAATAQVGVITAESEVEPAISQLPTNRTINVNSTADAEPNATSEAACTNGTAGCTLRAAIYVANEDYAANGTAKADTINIAAGTYTLSATNSGNTYDSQADYDYHYDIDSSVNLVGAGTGSTIINANNLDQVFEFDSGVVRGTSANGFYDPSSDDDYMSGMTLENGLNRNNPASAECSGADTSTQEPFCILGGGAIYDSLNGTGSLTLNSVAVVDSSTVYTGSDANDNGYAYGGGLYIGDNMDGVVGTLEIDNSSFTGNIAGSSGGGVYNYGQCVQYALSNDTFTNNISGQSTDSASADPAAAGGGFYMNGGGVCSGEAADTLTSITATGNKATDQGGAIYTIGPVTASALSVSGNTAGSFGGGMLAYPANYTVSITASTFTANTLIGNSGETYGGGGGNANGAGMCVESESSGDDLSIHYSRFHGNTITSSRSGLGANGLGVTCATADGDASVNATDNWWGCNPTTSNGSIAGTGCDTALTSSSSDDPLTVSPYTTLTLGVSSTSPGDGSTITATGSLGQDSSGAPYSSANDPAYDATPITAFTLTDVTSTTTSGATFSSTAATGASSAAATASGVIDATGTGMATLTVDGATLTQDYTISSPDLAVASTHSGNFKAGDTADTYTLTVTNSGNASTSGTVTVTDALPGGFTTEGISGSGWTCNQASLTCTQTAALAQGASYPAITLTVSVSSSDAGSYTNNVSVSGGGGVNASPTGTNPTIVVGEPTIAEAFSPTSVAPGAISTVTFTLGNPSANTVSLTGVAFADTLPVSLVVATPSGAATTCSGGAVAATAAGSSIALSGATLAAGATCTVTVNVESPTTGSYTNTTGNVTATNSNPGATASAMLTVTKGLPIVAASSPSVVYGTASTTLSATVAYTGATAPTGGLSFTVNGGTAVPSTCSGASSPLTCEASYSTASLAVTTYTITATEAADTNYSMASGNGTLTVTKATPTVTVSSTSITQGTASTTLSATVAYTGSAAPTGGLSFTVNGGSAVAATCSGASSPLTCSATYPTSTLTVTSSPYTLSALEATDSNYNTASGGGTLTVGAAVPGAPIIGVAVAGNAQATVSFTVPASNGGATITSYTVTSSPGGFTAVSAGSPITVTGLVNGTAYTFTVTATNSAGTSVASAASNSVMPKASQAITFANPGSQVFGTSPTLMASSNSTLAVTFSSSTMAVCTITPGGALTFVSTGTCTINVNQAGDAAYSAAPQVSQSFSVVVPAPTISGISPNSGTAAGGTSVTIIGTNLGAATSITFGGVVATITADSEAQIMATTPAGTVGAVNVVVTTVGVSSTLVGGYTYTAPGYMVSAASDDASGVAGNCVAGATSGEALNNDCSLRDALAAANGVGGANITFDPTVFVKATTISPGSGGTLIIPTNTSITGPTSGSGATLTNLVTVSGASNGGNPIFTVNGGTSNTFIANLTMTGANLGVSAAGGAIYNGGTLVVNNSTFSGNTGGAIYNYGTLTVSNSTFSGNTIANAGAGGGAISDDYGTLTVSNSTFSGNTALNFGGGAIFTYAGPVTVSNSTFSGNIAPAAGAGGAIATIDGPLTVSNSILSGDTGGECANLSTGNTCLTNGSDGNIVGVAANLSALGNYGGPTQTMLPLPGSAAIGAGSYITGEPATDQRGFTRPFTSGAVIDSGAVQTSYAISFSTDPSAEQISGVSFPVGVTLTESGNPLSGVTIPLTLNGGGTLTGGSAMTNANGVASYTLTATNATTLTGLTLTATLPAPPTLTATSTSFTLRQATLALTPTSLSAATVGVAYTQTLSTSGGSGSYTYAVTAGALPAGLLVSIAGSISGTPTAAGSFSFMITATDTAASSFTGSQAYMLTVNAPTFTLLPASGAKFTGTAETPYTQTFAASGGTSPYTYGLTVVTGTLPTGLTLNAATGVLSGTPTSSGVVTFTIKATDSSTGTGAPFSVSGSYTLTVTAPTVTVTPATLPNATVAVVYPNTTLSASGGTGPYTYLVTSGALPAGITLSSGVLSGTPTAGGVFHFTVTATDATSFTGSQAYTLTVNAPTFTLLPASGAKFTGTAETPYTQTFAASGGTSPYSYMLTVNTGTLPTGLTLNAATGVLSGTPTSSGVVTFTIKATDSSTGTGAPFSVSGSYTLTVNGPTITVAPAMLPGAAFGVAYSQALMASGGTGAYTYAVTAGVLPAGITLSSAGVLSGAATTSGKFNFTVTATDADSFTGNQAYSLTVSAPTVMITPATLPAATVGTAYSATIVASGGTVPYTYAITSGALPAGLTLNAGVLSGTPTVGGTFSLTVMATDSSTSPGPYTGAATYSLTVNSGAVTLSFAAVPAETFGNPPFTVSATSASSGAITYSLVNGNATVSGTGLVTPTGAGAVTVKASQAATASYGSATAQTTINVMQQPSMTVVSASSSTATSMQAVTLTAMVSATIAGTPAVPTGTVTFFDNGTPIGAAASVVSGTATLMVPSLPSGATATITAVYSGDGNFLGSTSSNSTSVMVASLDFTFTNTGVSAYRTAPGAVATYSFGLAPLYGSYPGPVNFTVTGLPSGATASFTPSSVAVGGGVTPVMMTVQTTPATAKNHQGSNPFGRGIVLALLLLPFGMKRSLRKKLNSKLLLLLLLLTGTTVAMSGCGASNGVTLQEPHTYTLTVTATSGTLQHSQTVTLIVQ